MKPPSPLHTRPHARRTVALLGVVALATLGHTACCGCSTEIDGPRADLEARYLPAVQRTGNALWPVGADISLRFELVNRGPEVPTHTMIQLHVPIGWRVVSVQCTAIGTAVCPPTGAVMDTGPVPVGSGFVIGATLAQLVPARGEVSINFTAWAVGDREVTNNAAFTRHTIWSADRRVSYSAPAQAAAGDSVEWQLTIDNAGPDTALVVPAASFPAGINPGPQICRVQGGSVCVSDAAGGLQVAAGARTVVVFPLVISAGFAGNITSTADDGLAGDPTPADNRATATLAVN